MKLHNIYNCAENLIKVNNTEEIDLSPDDKELAILNICAWIKRHPEHLRIYIEVLSKAFGEYIVIDEHPDTDTGLIIAENCLDLDT